MPKEQYMCQLCANHGIFNQPKKGHKQKCPYRTCPCSLCALNTKRRALDQIERQLKHSAESVVPSSSNSSNTECQLSPTTIKLQSTVIPSGRDTYRQSVSNGPVAFTVQLPATITRKELKLLRRDENPQPSLKRSYKSLDDAIETIKKQKSIFHSAEMLAGSESSSKMSLINTA
ncbi:unnamed protein product [Caenorhabditis bovis]|uniref:DM domain-containing protein n=1 Tax=Caenorhabditis bovis TaxID=2654633 RepID=A0A8S1ECU9_9PELO|nr:unnamed protein product [Caenorhabditis bovis]